MRNLTEHPITKREMLVAIDNALEAAYNRVKLSREIGDITPAALEEVRDRIEKMED